MVRCRAKGESYSYDFAASLQNTNEQSILISERDLTAWKGAAERMLTNEIVLKVFSDYLNRDTDFEVILTSRGYTVMGFDNHRQDWNTVDFCPTPEALRDSLLNAYESFRELEITGGDRDLTEKEEAKLAKERDALTALRKGGCKMFILKILFAPLSLILSLFVWLCAGLLSCSGFVFKLASGLLSLLAFAVLITYSVKNGIILLVLAFLISPMGLPMLAVQGLGKLQDVNSAMKNFIHS